MAGIVRYSSATCMEYCYTINRANKSQETCHTLCRDTKTSLPLTKEVIANLCSAFRDSYPSQRAAVLHVISQKNIYTLTFSLTTSTILNRTKFWLVTSRVSLIPRPFRREGPGYEAKVEYDICTRPSLRVPMMQYIRCCGVEGVACEATIIVEKLYKLDWTVRLKFIKLNGMKASRKLRANLSWSMPKVFVL